MSNVIEAFGRMMTLVCILAAIGFFGLAGAACYGIYQLCIHLMIGWQ